MPLGCPGEPDVVLWPLESQVHFTLSPAWIVTDAGEKTKLPLGPIVTLNVVALAGVE